MRKPLLIVGVLACIVYACNQSNNPTHLLSTGNLPTQVFNIDITKDTTLHTKNGALIRIPHGALSGKNPVQLEVKEAYSMQDIVKGGLTTMGNGQPLSSGGMIYINAVGGNKVTFNQPISISTPAPFLDSSMQLYKGALQSDSTINWVEPKPLDQNPQLTTLQIGDVIFQNNCASCHALGKDLTGPDLAHIMKRVLPYIGEGGPITHPYTFIRNPARVIQYDGYYRCLKEKFGGVVMTSFPELTNRDFNILFDYIENESERRHLPGPDNSPMKFADSCKLYWEATTHWKEVKARLEEETVNMVEEKLAPTSDTTGDPVKVSPTENQSLYYQFNIEAFGWYNVDMLLKTNVATTPGELRLRIRGRHNKVNLYLIIPSVKLFAEGGLLNGEEGVYGFDKEDGSIPLPQNARAYIVAMGEHEDSIVFSKTEFITKEKQEFTLELTTISKEAFQQLIASLQLGDLTITANDTKNAAELRNTVKELKKAEQLKPKNCDCNCLLENPATAFEGAENAYISEWSKRVSSEDETPQKQNQGY